MNIKAEKAVTTLQRPLMFVLMIISCPSMLVLGALAVINLLVPAITGEQPIKEGANIFVFYGLLSLACIVPFALSWFSGKMVIKAWKQMREKGVLYQE